MIKHDITAGLFAPVEFLLTEAEVGSGCAITYLLPSSLMVLDANPEMRTAAEALDAKLGALIAHATES